MSQNNVLLRLKLLRARTLHLGETADDDEGSDPPEPRLTRQQQRDLRNGMARGRGGGKGRGRGRGKKTEKEVEDIPDNLDDPKDEVEDLPGDTPKVDPKPKRKPRTAKPKPETKVQPKAKSKAAKTADDSTGDAASSKPKAKARGRKAKGLDEATGASKEEGKKEQGKRKRKSQTQQGKPKVPKKLKEFEAKGIPVEEREPFKQFLWFNFSLYVFCMFLFFPKILCVECHVIRLKCLPCLSLSACLCHVMSCGFRRMVPIKHHVCLQSHPRLVQKFQKYRIEPYWSRIQAGVRNREEKPERHAYLATTPSMKLNIEICNFVVAKLSLVLRKYYIMQ